MTNVYGTKYYQFDVDRSIGTEQETELSFQKKNQFAIYFLIVRQ
jgi:hypothetical protein